MKTTTNVKCHRDGTVTVWDVYSRQWLRTERPSDRVLASLGRKDRARVERHLSRRGSLEAAMSALRVRRTGQGGGYGPWMTLDECPHDVREAIAGEVIDAWQSGDHSDPRGQVSVGGAEWKYA